ncbi:hypothetical protein KCU65_g8451, partial [Aureobasidium melanogenum]
MSQIVDDLWAHFGQLKKEIEVMLGDPGSDLPKTLVEARTRQALGQQQYVALQERLYEVRAILQNFFDQVNAMQPSKDQVIDRLRALQNRLNSAPSNKDFNDAKDEIRKWEAFWQETEPELNRLKAQKKEMDGLALKAASYDRLQPLEATMKQEHEELVGLRKQRQQMEEQARAFALKEADYVRLQAMEGTMKNEHNDFIAKQADYLRLTKIENRLIANDADYKDLLKKSNEMKNNAKELGRLRQMSNKMREDAAELDELRHKSDQVEEDEPEA